MAETAKKKRRWVVHSHDASRPDHSNSMSDINITPLIDVMLVLLIIFMVVTPVAQKGLDIALPQPPPPNQPPEKAQSNTVVLAFETPDILTVNQTPVGMIDLEQRLKDIYSARQDKTIFVKAKAGVPYRRVVQAMDIARGAGAERIGIISDKMIEQSGS